MSRIPVGKSISAYACASETTRESINFMSNFWREKGAMAISQQGDTLLHFLAVFGNVTTLKEFLQEGLLSNGEMAIRNDKGDSALHEAARYGKRDFAEAMACKEQGLVFGVNNKGETPLFVAAASGNKEVFWLLEELSSDCFTRSDDGSTVLHAAINGGYYLLALSIVDSYPDLARKHDGKGSTPLHLLASTPSAFRSGSSFLIRHLGRKALVVLQVIKIALYLAVPALYVEGRRESNLDQSYGSRVVINKMQRSFIIRIVLGWGWLKELDDIKQKHVVALILSKRLIEEEKDWSHYINCSRTLDISEGSWVVANPLIEATKNDLDELAIEILRKYPNAANCLDANGRNILHIAVKHKSRAVYEVLKKSVAHKDRMVADLDYQGNTILHHATHSGQIPNFRMIDFYQTNWDVHWFKIIKREGYSHQLYIKNKDGKTAKELFEKCHSTQRDRAEKTLKDVNQGLMVVSTLIGAISIAALLSIPGGFNDSGHPVLVDNYKDEMQWFFLYACGSLLASILSVAGLVSIQMSAFHIEDFYVTLPLQFLLSSTAVFYSTGFTFALYAQAYILESSLELAPAELIAAGVVAFMCMFYADETFRMYAHMYEVVYYSFAYKTPKL